ncbi:lycopene cyclase family protein [Sphingobacterium sp. lm-10]|uniref:lycopene cyclase family protein n=1 Tax=Sphingobacterium sp. lm-10 TaxID=2944904 RepID=UPI002020F86D|nr:lycopene cyclase family protein [Sphingobacterium sp. lm-10]MCL7986877.1 lycopene cyclase family protein [Sphingobacterium sp. lm-10]
MQQSSTNYHIAILGAGIAGLTLLLDGLKQNIWENKSILLLGESLNNTPNKRISFWSTATDPIPDFPYLKWDKLSVVSNDGVSIPLKLDDYSYYSFDASAYRKHALKEIKKYENVTVVEGKVQHILQDDKSCEVRSDEGVFFAEYVFQTIFEEPTLKPHNQYFLQHFTGWKIRTEHRFSDPEEAVIMDYRTSQEHGTSFIYGLPASDNEIFVEYTIFSKSLISREEYAEKLALYLREVCHVKDYEITEEEYGVIPMTDYHFKRRDGRVFFLGSAGGDTRGSTGYTYTNVKRTISQILEAFKRKTWPQVTLPSRRKEQFYDAILLHVLAQGGYPGHMLFTDLFNKARASHVFQFLDAQSDFTNDLRIMWSLRKWPFILGMLRTLRLMVFKR